MEPGQSSLGNIGPMQSLSMRFCGDNIAGEDVPDQIEQKPHIMDLMEFGKSNWNNPAESLPLPWWVQPQEASSHQNYVQYLAENSAFVPIATPEPDMVYESLALPYRGTQFDVPGLSDFGTHFPYTQYLGQDFGPTSNELDAWKRNEDRGSQLSTTHHQAQDYISWMENSNGDDSGYIAPQVDTPSAGVAARAGSATKPRARVSNAKSRANDRQRRIRITENLTALQELLPHAEEGSQPSILDDVIDYVKYLQLQIKDLCESKTRLEHQSTSVPIIFREGYGHYLCDQELLSEPLEEMVGKLLELNPSEAMQLLQMKGLLLMPV